ncbi:hypothetical protein LXL04_005612 [Taraxacum kok-saghyz]
MRAPWITSIFFALFLIFSSIATQPIVRLLDSWTNDESSFSFTDFTDGSKIRAMYVVNGDQLNLTTPTPTFTCGFFCNGTCESYIFAILISLPISSPVEELKNIPEVVWSANRDHPVSNGAILNLNSPGGFVLQDANGSIVWTTNITAKSITGSFLNIQGNLGLVDDNVTVWESFAHPTDCLVRGQKLYPGQELTTSASPFFGGAQKDLYSLKVSKKGVFAYVESNPPQAYFERLANTGFNNVIVGMAEFESDYVKFVDTGLHLNIKSTDQLWGISVTVGVVLRQTYTLRYIKLMPDGHLKVFGWDMYVDRDGDAPDLLTNSSLGECSYPMTCGRNAICSTNHGQCSCPESFSAVDTREPKKGCIAVTPLTCNATQFHYFVEVKNVTYVTYSTDMENVDMKNCTQACLDKCSCKAAIFKYNGSNSTNGSCHLPSELFTMSVVIPNNNLAFIKVQNSSSRLSLPPNLSPPPQSQNGWRKSQVATILGSTIGSFVFLLIVVVGFTKFILRKKKRDSEMEEEYLDQVPGMPTRFPYEELKTATENFSKKLGEGGFGSVFEGTLKDGSRIAVKCLQGHVHVKKSFMAEVESIGSIHHVNLVRLRGFSAWKSERLLVYDFMSKGSLDQWIYSGDRKHVLGWECRKKIIFDIAKGLAYLHEECRQKIIHLDIKPQNILLDEDFNAKVSDFGLSKLVDRNQSQVITRMRGTPGYLAPEWLGSVITEKVDVYSFGIVLLEMLCGRKNFDISLPEESWHLLRVFQTCWEQGTLLDIVDTSSEDMKVHGAEVMEMMKIASWCLQTDFTKRPSMSSVMKVLLDGVMDVELNLSYNFTDPSLPKTKGEHVKNSKPFLPSILSGPR